MRLASKLLIRLRRATHCDLSPHTPPETITNKRSAYDDWLEVLGKDIFLLCVKWLDVRWVGVCAQVSKNWNGAIKTNTLWFFLISRDFPKKVEISNNLHPQSVYRTLMLQESEEQALRERMARVMERASYDTDVFRMFHPTNGRINFLPFTPTVPIEKMPDRETLLQILALENELRLSKEVQDEYWLSRFPTGVTLKVQTQVVSKFGYSDPWIIPSAMYYYKDDKEVMDIPHYVKYNRSRQGRLGCGDTIPEIPLSTMNGCATSLRERMEPYSTAPVVLVAGSYT
jgi:hypothetical protein